MTTDAPGAGIELDPVPPTVPGWRPFGDLVVPASIRARIDRPELAGIVELVLEMGDHRPEVVSLTLHRRPGGPPITGTAIRTVTVERLTRDVLLTASQRAVSTDGARITTRSMTAADAPDLERLLARRQELGAWKLDDDHLAAVAKVYAAGEALGRPVIHVAATFGVPRPTASRWCALARQRFYIDAGPLGLLEECESCGTATRAAHHVTADLPDVDGDNDGGAITATYCPRHCPGHCDKEH